MIDRFCPSNDEPSNFTDLKLKPSRLATLKKRLTGAALTSLLAASATIFPASDASAQQQLNNVRLFSDGDCGVTTPTGLLVQIVSVPSQYNTTDEVIDFGGGVTQNQDVLVFYTTDANNVVIGRTAQAFPTGTGLANDLFIQLQQRPTVTGNFTVRVADETDRTPDRALGSTFSGGILTNTFDGAALDADCVPPPADTTAPEAVSLLRRTGADFTTNANTLIWDIVFSEDVQNVGANDLLLSGTTATASVSGSGTTYAVTVSGGNLAGLNGLVQLSLRSTGSSIQDPAGNAYAGGAPAQNQPSYTVDNASDTVSITTASAQVSGTFEVVVEFQSVGPAQATNPGNVNTGTLLSAFQFTNATRTGASSMGGSTLRFNVTPTSAGPVSVSLPAATANDTAGNPNQASNTLAVSYVPPNQAPTASASAAQTAVTSGTQVQLQGAGTDTDGTIASYAWTRTGGTGSAANASLSSATAQNPTFTDASLTSNDSAVTHVFSLTVTDDDGATSVADTVTITINPPPNAAPTATASAAALSVTSGTQVQLLGSGTDTDGSIQGYSWSRTGGTGSAANASLSSTTAQNPTFTDNSLAIGDTSVTHVFSLIVSDDDAADSVADTVTITITAPPDEEAPVIASPAPISAEAGPGGTASVAFTASVTDNFDPVVAPVFTLNATTISSPFDFPIGVNNVLVDARDTAGNDAVQQTLVVTVTSAVAPDAPIISTSDINADRSLTIGGTAEADATVRVTFPDATFQEMVATGGVFSVSSAANMIGGTTSVIATDGAGNPSVAATVDLFPDYDRPTVEIAGAPSRVVDETPFTISITFSEVVTGFAQSDVSVTGAAVTAFAGTGAAYTAEITPIAGEDISISIAAGVAQDAFTNTNDASNTIEIADAALTETEEFITSAAQSRNRSLISAQPKINRFLLGGQLGSFNAAVTQGAGNFDFTTSSDRPVWFAGQGRWTNSGALESSYANLAIGAHYTVNPNLMIGAMTQFDTFIAEEDDATYEGTGWLLGPYGVLRMSEQPLVVSASYLVGQAENDASPLGTYEDNFKSDRTLLTLGVAGKLQFERIALFPALDLKRATDENESYTGGDGFAVRSQKVTTTEATLGLDFSMPVNTSNGALELLGGLGLTASESDFGPDAGRSSRGNLDLGFRYDLSSGGRVNAKASYDGLGQDDYEAIGAEVVFEIDF